MGLHFGPEIYEVPRSFFGVGHFGRHPYLHLTDTIMSSSELSLESNDQRVSYGIAMNMGANIMRQGGVEIDTTAFLAGLKDGLSGATPQVSEDDLKAAFASAQAKVESAAAEGSAEQTKVGQAFLDENKARDGVLVTESGLQYEIMTAADGAKPTAEQTVEVHYHGTLVDGTVFDSSVSRGEPISFPVKGVIPGWVEGLQLMTVGSKWKLFIPADLGYGNSPQGPIPAGSTLIFEVELLSIK